MHKIYENIRILRVTRGWTQQELAEKMGYTEKSIISKIEKGKVDLTLSKVDDFAKIFGTTPAQLMGLEDGIDETTRKLARSLTRIMEYSEKSAEIIETVDNDPTFLPSREIDNKKKRNSKKKKKLDNSEIFQKKKVGSKE